jgi:hypothetical protein
VSRANLKEILLCSPASLLGSCIIFLFAVIRAESWSHFQGQGAVPEAAVLDEGTTVFPLLNVHIFRQVLYNYAISSTRMQTF